MAFDRPRAFAALQALLVCFVWSTSFIITKQLYRDGIGPVTLTGLRYALAGLALLPLWLWRRRTGSASPRPPRPRPWLLAALGLAGYAVNPLGYTLALAVLPASLVGVVLGVNNTVQVLLFGTLLLRERPTRVQLAAVAVAVLGTIAFHTPGAVPVDTLLLPALAMVLSGTGYASWVVGNRLLLRRTGALALVCPSMLAGASPVLAVGVGIEGIPRLPASAWSLMAVLAIVNTSAAFLLWTHTQRRLAAHQSAVINNTMTVQIALLAFLFLGESLTAWQWAMTGIVAGSTIAVQVGGRSRGPDALPDGDPP